ncbi:siroheme synthase [Enterococcus ureilyticus]|uniref:precorrin-2 dehydrogenase n=1 Tax=Enterococcus ureilyticus TaxID=1131292 RepID=A0A1E5HEY8_9ENTE|nr:bifunctional precorrin-2 dehydrogenase/sirohydrochlorin ferrochelatase [Enterococcus ureilyticus]MBM7689241.1 precorrin-2 dehydrogenase/sirohydrochlorin ferrochelatase [Enterococcus ureilyticus]OEG23517.1 siroheme synthase [Enterococcus ureilyticus]
MYPVMLNLTGKKIVIIGGGRIALRKTVEILKAHGQVTLVAPTFLPEFNELVNTTLITATYTAERIKEAHLIFACTDSKTINQQIVKDAKAYQWVNDCSQKENSDFYNMSTIEQEDYLIALSSYGTDPAALKGKKQALVNLLSKKNK